MDQDDEGVMNPYYAMVLLIIQVLIAVLAAAVSAIVAYGAVASAVIGFARPNLYSVPCFRQMEFLFWGWLRAFIGFCFYKVLARRRSQYLGTFTRGLLHPGVAFLRPGSMVQELPLLILLVFVNVYILFKVPAMTQSLFAVTLAVMMAGWCRNDGNTGRAVNRNKRNEVRDEHSNEATPEITRAAERYLEQYGDPLVMNTPI